MMTTQHASPEALERFLLSEASADERSSLVRHLLAQCPECLGAAALVPSIQTLAAGRPRPVPEDSYDESFARVEMRVLKHAGELQRERNAAAGQWRTLTAHPPERRRMRAHNDRRFHTWGFAERLLDESRRSGRRSAAQALEAAELAVEVASRLDEARYGAQRLDDLRALAWEALGNARRWQGDLDGAAEALRCAQEHLAKGTGDPLVSAMVTSTEAALSIDLGHFEGVADSLAQAVRTFRRLGDRYLEGRAQLLEAVVLGQSDPDRATVVLRQALEKIEASEPGRAARLVERFAPLLSPWGIQPQARRRAGR